MANISTLNTVAAGADAVSQELGGPRGRKPRKRLSRRNIMLYGTLLVAALTRNLAWTIVGGLAAASLYNVLL